MLFSCFHTLVANRWSSSNKVSVRRMMLHIRNKIYWLPSVSRQRGSFSSSTFLLLFCWKFSKLMWRETWSFLSVSIGLSKRVISISFRIIFLDWKMETTFEWVNIFECIICVARKVYQFVIRFVIICFALHDIRYMLPTKILTWPKFEWASLDIHRKVLEVHGASRFDGESAKIKP